MLMHEFLRKFRIAAAHSLRNAAMLLEAGYRGFAVELAHMLFEHLPQCRDNTAQKMVPGGLGKVHVKNDILLNITVKVAIVDAFAHIAYHIVHYLHMRIVYMLRRCIQAFHAHCIYPAARYIPIA